MISAVHELAEKETYIIGHHHKCVAEYIEACHKLFEEDILSHKTVSSMDQQILVNMDKGFQLFSNERMSCLANILVCTMCIQSNMHTVSYQCFYICRCETEESTTEEFPCLASM